MRRLSAHIEKINRNMSAIINRILCCSYICGCILIMIIYDSEQNDSCFTYAKTVSRTDLHFGQKSCPRTHVGTNLTQKEDFQTHHRPSQLLFLKNRAEKRNIKFSFLAEGEISHRLKGEVKKKFNIEVDGYPTPIQFFGESYGLGGNSNKSNPVEVGHCCQWQTTQINQSRQHGLPGRLYILPHVRLDKCFYSRAKVGSGSRRNIWIIVSAVHHRRFGMKTSQSGFWIYERFSFFYEPPTSVLQESRFLFVKLSVAFFRTRFAPVR